MRPRSLGLLLFAVRASASLAQPAAPVEPRASVALEEIIVSARRRDENLQDAPVSVSVLRAEDLADRSITRLEDIAAHTPNLRRSAGPQGGSSAHYFIRGVGQLDFIASMDPGVGVYVDGVYLGRTTGATFDLLDIDRVEVLRGPQGTLFGRNTIGGAVNVIGARPPDEPSGTASLTVGERARREARVTVGGPLGDGRVVASAALLAKTQDGWQRSLATGMRFGDQRTYAARTALDWLATDKLTLAGALDATRGRGTADPHYLAAVNTTLGGRTDYVVTDSTTTWAGQRSRDDLDAQGASLTATYELPRFTLKSISAYRALESSTGIDFDGSPFNDIDQRVITDQQQRSEEIQLAGATSHLTWLAGAYYFNETVDQQIPAVLFGASLSQNNALENRSYALFSHLSYALTERLSISGGARYTRERKQHGFDHYFEVGAIKNRLFPPTTLNDRWRSFTPKIGVELRVGGDALLYASWSEGFRSGGFNGRPFGTDEFLAYDPENLATLEVGVKSEWLDRRLRLNAAAFFSRYEDIQLTRTTLAASGAPIVVTGNAGEAELSGLELEITAALREGLTLSANVGNLRNEYTEIAPGAAVLPGNKLPVSPRWSVSTGIEHTAMIGAARVRGRIDYSYTSRFNYFFDNPELSWEPAGGVWNARIALAPTSSDWELALFVLDATNERRAVFREDVRASFGVALVWPGEPRQWGIEARYSF